MEVQDNDLVLLNLLKFLSYKDLLTSSLVNKRWNALSRHTLKSLHRPKLVLIFSPEEHEELQDKLLWICKSQENEKFPPFFATLKLRPPSKGCRCQMPDVSSVNTNNQVKMSVERQLQRLPDINLFSSVEVSAPTSHNEDCEWLYLLMNFVCKKLDGGSVLRLKLNIKKFDLSWALVTPAERLRFPNLVSLDCGSSVDKPDLDLGLRKILGGSRALKTLHGQFRDTTSLLSLLRAFDKCYLLQHLHLNGVTLTSEEALSPLQKFVLKREIFLTKISVAHSNLLSSMDLPEFSRIFIQLLEKNGRNLENLQVDVGLFFDFVLFTSSIMLNLRDLTLDFGRMNFDKRIRLLQSVPWTRFPRVDHLNFGESGAYTNFPVHPRALTQPTSRCMSVTRLCFWSFLRTSENIVSVLERIARVFPLVRTLTLPCFSNSVEQFLAASWSTIWRELHTIQLTAVEPRDFLQFAPVIMGVDEREWTFWQEKGLDVRRMQIAPVMDCIRCCAKLQNILVKWEKSGFQATGMFPLEFHSPGWYRVILPI